MVRKMNKKERDRKALLEATHKDKNRPDQALALGQAIQETDPNVEKPFTKVDARKALAGVCKKHP